MTVHFVRFSLEIERTKKNCLRFRSMTKQNRAMLFDFVRWKFRSIWYPEIFALWQNIGESRVIASYFILFILFLVTCHSVWNIQFKSIACREILLHEGIWDMIRVDHGTEACLMLFVQNLMRNERGNLGCEPYVQTQSRQLSTLPISFFSLLSKAPTLTV